MEYYKTWREYKVYGIAVKAGFNPGRLNERNSLASDYRDNNCGHKQHCADHSAGHQLGADGPFIYAQAPPKKPYYNYAPQTAGGVDNVGLRSYLEKPY